jgi:hypothetical protein
MPEPGELLPPLRGKAESEGSAEDAGEGNTLKLKFDCRALLLQADDAGCTLKLKCRPWRQDGTRGEVATSKPSPRVE